MRAQGDTIEAIAERLAQPYTTVREAVAELARPANSSRRGRPHKLTEEQEAVLIRGHLDEGKSMFEAYERVR
jgi:hypothetical protein